MAASNNQPSSPLPALMAEEPLDVPKLLEEVGVVQQRVDGFEEVWCYRRVWASGAAVSQLDLEFTEAAQVMRDHIFTATQALVFLDRLSGGAHYPPQGEASRIAYRAILRRFLPECRAEVNRFRGATVKFLAVYERMLEVLAGADTPAGSTATP